MIQPANFTLIPNPCQLQPSCHFLYQQSQSQSNTPKSVLTELKAPTGLPLRGFILSISPVLLSVNLPWAALYLTLAC